MTVTNRKQLIWLLGTLMLVGGLILIDVARAGSSAPTIQTPRWADLVKTHAMHATMNDPSDVEENEEEDEYDDIRPGQAPKLKKLSPEEISRIRYMELRGMRLKTKIPDRVQVKIARDTIDEFLIEMEGHPDFRGKKRRREFLKKTPPQKLHIMAKYRGPDYADRVEIRNDPEIFVEFRRHVLPTLLRTCATSGCHSPTNEEAFGFRLFKDPKKTDATVYANFIIVNDLERGRQRMIDRGQPEDSLLLTYMLPKKDVKVEFRHPGDVDYKPVFQSRKAPRLKRIQRWIASLKHPAEDYGVRLIPRPPMDQEEEDDASATSRPNSKAKTPPK